MRLLLTFAIATVFATFAQDLAGQQPLKELFQEVDRHRPRGRLLKQLFGGDDSSNQEQAANSNNAQQNQAGKQPTPAQRTQNQNARTNPQNGRAPANQHQANQQQQPRPQNNNIRNQSAQPTSSAQSSRVANDPTTTKSQVTLGARLTSPRTGKGLVVSQVTRGSAAEDAGLQQGDLITSFGGIEVAKEDEINDVLSILSQGDQIEIEYTRRGKADKMYVQFGEPNVDTLNEGNTTAKTPRSNSNSQSSNNWETTNSSRQSSTNPNRQGAYDPIQPPQTTGNTTQRNPNFNSQNPVSVLSNLHGDSTPTPHHAISNEKDLGRQVQELQAVIQQQEQIIQRMQNQLSDFQNRSRSQSRPTLAPRGR